MIVNSNHAVVNVHCKWVNVAVMCGDSFHLTLSSIMFIKFYLYSPLKVLTSTYIHMVVLFDSNLHPSCS